MSMHEFLRQNRKEIDQLIKTSVDKDYRINNKDREDWVRNDEGLYNWARRSGVRI